jgi:hypothetical protein
MLNVKPTATAQQVNAQSLDIVGEIAANGNNINIVMTHQPTAEQVRDLNTASEMHDKPVALLGGEFSLMVNNAKHLSSRGYQCFTATTERKSVEVVNEDGTTTKKSIFSYVTLRPVII